MFTKPTQEEINSAMLKLGQADWISSNVQVQTKGTMKLTAAGDEKMLALAGLLTELSAHGKPSVGEFSAIAALALEHDLRRRSS